MNLLAVLSILIASALAEPNITALLQSIPECALECVIQGPGKVGCGALDLECQCGKLENITAIVAPCMVHANCTLEEIMQTGTTVVKQCEGEYNMTSNDSDGNAFGGSEDKPGAAPRLYGAGWVALSASVFAVMTIL